MVWPEFRHGRDAIVILSPPGAELVGAVAVAYAAKCAGSDLMPTGTGCLNAAPVAAKLLWEHSYEGS